jgi:hypothetical protein
MEKKEEQGLFYLFLLYCTLIAVIDLGQPDDIIKIT